MTDRVDLPDPLPWAQIASPLARAEDTLARLDERRAKSPIAAGFVARTHFSAAAASLWLDGERVDLEDLVLHDAGMDSHAPTPELSRAHMVLRARRRIAAAPPGWALSPGGIMSLRGRAGVSDDRAGEHDDPPGMLPSPDHSDADREDDDLRSGRRSVADRETDPAENDVAAAVAAIDRLIARSDRMLADPAVERKSVARPERSSIVYDLDWDEDDRLSEWHRAVAATAVLPPVLAAALALDAWDTIAPLQHLPWLGSLLASAMLRERGKTRAHLICLTVGLRAVPRDRRRARSETVRLVALLDAVSAAAEIGLAEHDRWMLARKLLIRKLAGRRSTSRLPALVDFVLSRPLVSAGMIAEALGVTPRAAQDMVVELGLREATGRGRYRAWGVL